MPAPTRSGTGSVRRGERTSAVVPLHIPQARRVSPQAPPELQDAVPSKAARNLSGIVYRYVPSRIPFSHAMRVPLRKRRPREHIPFNRHRKRQHRSRTHHERFVPAVPPFPTRLSKSGFSRREDRSHVACGPMRNAGPRPTTGCACGIEGRMHRLVISLPSPSSRTAHCRSAPGHGIVLSTAAVWTLPDTFFMAHRRAFRDPAWAPDRCGRPPAWRRDRRPGKRRDGAVSAVISEVAHASQADRGPQ